MSLVKFHNNKMYEKKILKNKKNLKIFKLKEIYLA